MGQASADAKAFGIDGVYLHGHEGYLIDQLTNPAFNRRKLGKYADWQRFGIEMVKEIRRRTGDAYPIMYRIDLSCALNETYGDEMENIPSLKKFTNGRSVEQTLEYMKNLVAAGVADEALIQLSYAIGIAQPVSVFVNTYGTAKVNMTDGEIARKVQQLFDLRPKAIEERLKLRNPIYSETAAYGHVGRTPQTVTKTFESRYLESKTITVELFTWEKLDYVEKVKEAFAL